MPIHNTDIKSIGLVRIGFGFSKWLVSDSEKWLNPEKDPDLVNSGSETYNTGIFLCVSVCVALNRGESAAAAG